MITLIVLINLFGIYSIVRIAILSKRDNRPFSPLDYGLGLWMGFLFGGAVVFITMFYLIVKYLP